MTKNFSDVEAWTFLVEHPMVDYEGISMFHSCLSMEVVRVNPANETVESEDRLNTAVRVRLEFGPWEKPEELEEYARASFPCGIACHDVDLDCQAPTFEEAIIKLAELVLKKYGGRCPECNEWRTEDDRVKAGMKCGPCNYGYPSSSHITYF